MTEKSPFENMTPESIKSEMLGRVINAGVDVDAREGSYANILLSEAAYVMWKYGQTLNGFIDILFPGAQSGRYLDLHAAQIGMTRQPGAKAKVTVTFSGVNGTKIPAGTVVWSPLLTGLPACSASPKISALITTCRKLPSHRWRSISMACTA